MSWASVVKRWSSQETSQKVIIECNYNIESEPGKDQKNDDIPRHKETTPHPSDDYFMTNGKTDKDRKDGKDGKDDNDDKGVAINQEDFSKRIESNNKNNVDIDSIINVDLLVSGYIRLRRCLGKIPHEIKDIVRLYSYNIKSYSMETIVATHLIATIIDEYMNSVNNKCEFITNSDDELNILQYIYVKGGACRDSVLLRNIKDIDIVLDTHKLSKKYFDHLIKYHSKIENQNKECKCIFWRHYINNYTNYDLDDYQDVTSIAPSIDDDEDVIKILKFESFITNCEYLINAKFICDIIERTDKILYYKKQISSKCFGFSRHILLQSSINYNGFIINNVEFDITDNLIWHSYGTVQSSKQYRKFIGNEQVDNGLLEIDKFYNDDKNNKVNDENHHKILIPIYPFSTNSCLMYYDFTINCMHIDLYNILINNIKKRIGYNNKYDIDFYWDNKIINAKYNNDIINKYNIIGMNHIKHKILIPPNLNVITKVSANYYFWRLVKTAAKFIYQIKNNEWKIDEKYLKKTIKHYDLWFDDEFINSSELNPRFINKFLEWNISKPDDFIDRFHVFRYIKFEKYFISKIDKYPVQIKNNIEINMYALSEQERQVLIQCFKDFKYPNIWTSRFEYY